MSKRQPLTSEQQKLAEKYIPFARKLAKPLKLNWPQYIDEFDSAVFLALVEAAQSYDRARNIKFITYARYRIRGALRDVQRKCMLHGYRHSDVKLKSFVLSDESSSTMIGFTEDRPVSDDIDLLDWLEARLSPVQALLFKKIYIDGLQQQQIAQAIGMGNSCISDRHADAIKILQHSCSTRKLECSLS